MLPSGSVHTRVRNLSRKSLLERYKKLTCSRLRAFMRENIRKPDFEFLHK